MIKQGTAKRLERSPDRAGSYIKIAGQSSYIEIAGQSRLRHVV
jgi:hypothetical protein